MFAERLERAIGHAHVHLLDCLTGLTQRFGDVGVGHRAEQLAIDASLLRDRDHQVGHGFCLSLCCSQTGGFSGFEFGATGLKRSDVVAGRALGFALRNQEVAGIAVLDLNHVTQLTQVDHFFHEDDLHVVCSPQ